MDLTKAAEIAIARLHELEVPEDKIPSIGLMKELLPLAALKAAPSAQRAAALAIEAAESIACVKTSGRHGRMSRQEVEKYLEENWNTGSNSILGVQVVQKPLKRVVPPKGAKRVAPKPFRGQHPDKVFLDDLDEDGRIEFTNDDLSLFYEWWNGRAESLKKSPAEAARQAWGTAMELANDRYKRAIRTQALGTAAFGGPNQLRVPLATASIEPLERSAQAALESWCFEGCA